MQRDKVGVALETRARGTEVQPRDKISIATHILLNGVCDVNGAPLLAAGRIDRRARL